jgi:hypothetical protein
MPARRPEPGAWGSRVFGVAVGIAVVLVFMWLMGWL